MVINGVERKLHIDLQHTIIDGIITAEITYILVLIFLVGNKEENKEKLEYFIYLI
jgi:hypothetical protein